MEARKYRVRLMRITFKSPWIYGIFAVVTAAFNALAWAGIPSLNTEHDRVRWLLVFNIVFFFFAAAAFIALFYQKRKLEQQLEPKATLIYKPNEPPYVQYGNVDWKTSGGNQPCEEYKYRLGVVNLSKSSIEGLRMVFEDSQPYEERIHYLEKPLAVWGVSTSDGVFTLRPGDGAKPTVFVEILKELVPSTPGTANRSWIQLLYASEQGGASKVFMDSSDHVITLRLEGPMKPVWFKLLVKYQAQRRALPSKSSD